MGLFDDLLEEEDKIQPTKRRGLFDDLLEEEDLVSPTAPPRTTAPQAQLLPPIEEMFKPKPREVGTFEGIANAARNAFASSQQALAVTGGVTPEEAKEISKIEFEKNARQVSPDYKEYQEAQGFDAVKAFARNPFEVTTNIVAEGLAGSLPALGAGLAAGGVGAAVAAPTVVGAPVGFLAGQVAGTFAGSLATEYGGKVLEELQGAGMDINNPDSITDFFSRQELVDAAKDKALKRGVPIAAFDALSAGIGGKVGAITKAAFKTKPREAVAEMAVQAALGGGGEVVGSLAAGDKIDPKAVFAEVVGEVGPGAAEIGVGKIQQTFAERRKQEQIKRAAKVSQDLENNNAPLTADALKTTVAKNAVEEEKATIEETDTALAEEAAKFAPPEDAITKQELKTQYSALSPEDLTDTEATFRERLDDEDPEMRTFAQNALDAIAEVRAEQERARKLPTDVLPTETPSATYGREADIYDVFADIRRRPMPPSGPAFESAQVIEEAARRADVLRRTPEGRELLRRELQGEEMVGGVRRATEEALATAPEPAEGDVFAEIRRPSRAEEAAITIEQQLTEDERIRRSQLGAEALREELAQVESLSRVADNTATDEEVVRLARQGLVNIQDGQNVITPRGEEVMQRGGAPLPRLTPEERTAEVAAAPAIVEQAPTPTPVTPAPTPVTTPPVTEAVTPTPAAPIGEDAIVAAAVRQKDGKIFSAPLHILAIEAAKESGYPTEYLDSDYGFVTKSGKFLDSKSAREYSIKQKQVDRKILEDIEASFSKEKTPELESGAFSIAESITKDIKAQKPIQGYVVEEYNLDLPKGYTKQGDLYVYQPAVTATTPAPAEAAPVGIAVGNRVKTKTTPQSFIVEEVLPQSAREAELGEQYYSIRNERTGEMQVVEASDISPIKGKRTRKISPVRVEEKYTPVPEANRYTFREASGRAIRFFGGERPENFVIVNNSTDPDYEFKAGYDPETGEIILNRAYIQRGENIEDILTHELGHYIYSDPQFQADFQDFLGSMPDEARAEIDRIVNEGYNKETNEVQIEEREVMAFTSLIRRTKRGLTAWEKLKDTIKKIINRFLGTNITLSDQGAMAVFNVGYKRFNSGERIIREMREGVLKMAPEPTPATEAVVEEAPAERPKRRTKMQNIIDISTGVKRPKTKLTVNEMTALKDQIRMGARKRREDKRTQREFAKDLTQQLREAAIRGKVRPSQLRAITSKALQTQFDNEASILGFVNYANKVIENANYEKDLSDAKSAIKSAKRLAKQKGLAANIKANLEKLANIDPRQIEPEVMVEVEGETPISVAEFTAVLKEYMKAGGPVTAEEYVLVPDAEITDFLTKLGEQIETNRKATENLGMDGELAAIADKTPEEIDAELARDEERRNRIEQKINGLAEEAQVALVNYDNPEITSEEKIVLDDMKRITLSDISIGERKEFIKIANNILVNNKFLGAQKFASMARGQIGAVEAAKDSKTVNRNSATLKVYENLLGENFGRLVNLGTQSFADTFRNLTGTQGLPRLLYQMGFGEIERGQANTNRARREITDGVQQRFKQIEKETGQRIAETQGVYSMGVAGNLIQIHPDETEAEGIQRMRGLIEKDIEKKKKSPKTEDRKTALYVEKALDEVYADSIQGILDNLNRLHPANYKALTFLMNEVLPEYKPLLKEHDELFNNQTENYENPYYLPIRYRSIGTEPKKPGELRGRASDSVTAPKQAPNSIKRIKNSVLPEGKQFDYNLTRNVLDSLSTQLEAAYTNPGWQQVYAFLKTPEAVEALGGVENYDFVTKRINGLSDSRERRIYQMDPFNQAADFVANMVRKIGTSIALGGVGQAAKQMPDQVATTIANVNDLSITTPAFTEIKAALPAMRQFSIGERGEIAGGSKWVNQLEGNFTKLQQFMQDGVWPKAMEAFENLNNFWLIPLKVSDTVAASHGWISYYKKYLKDNNIPFTNWDNEAELIAGGERGRVEAGLYADQMIDLYQGSSDPTKMATFAQRGDSGGGNLLKTMIMPFSSFVIQQRSRILSDLRDISYGDTDEKKVAAKGLAGTLLGIVIFHGVRRYALPFLTGGVAAAAYGLLGVDMEEPDEEERLEKERRVFRQFLGEVASNIFVGGYSAYAETRLIDAVNAAAYFYEIQTQSENVLDDKGEIMSWEKYRKERAPMYRYTGPGADSTLGMLEILPSQAQETFDRLRDLADDEIMDSLTEEEQRVLILAALSETLYTMRLNDADVARMVKRMARDVKDQAEARQKAQRQLQRIYGQ